MTIAAFIIDFCIVGCLILNLFCLYRIGLILDITDARIRRLEAKTKTWGDRHDTCNHAGKTTLETASPGRPDHP